MSTTACNVRGKPSDGGLMQKVGPMKATIPMSSLLRPLNGSNNTVAGNVRTTLAGPANNLILYSAMSPPMRLISPDHNSSGHRSPGAANYFKVSKHQIADSALMSSGMRRTASLDALYMKPSWKIAHQFQLQQQLQQQASAFTILQLDKATQTDESTIGCGSGGGVGGGSSGSGIDGGNTCGYLVPLADYSSDGKIEKIVRQRLQRVQRAGEHSVSSQTLSPSHTSPVSIPIRPSTSHRPMRSSVEGLNQEIEKLVLVPGQQHSCRPESSNFSRGIPEGHRAPLADILHCDTRSVNTQTPSRDHLSSDESQSTSPDDNAASSGGTEASPRINRFLARLPPDGCEKVCLKSTDIDQISSSSTIFKPTVGFKLRPSLGSAFQPLQPILMPVAVTATVDASSQDTAAATASSSSPSGDT